MTRVHEPTICPESDENLTHEYIWREYGHLGVCPFCDQACPAAIQVESDEEETQLEPQPRQSQVTAVSLPRNDNHGRINNIRQSQQQQQIPESYPRNHGRINNIRQSQQQQQIPESYPRHQGRLSNLQQSQVIPTAPLARSRHHDRIDGVRHGMQRRAREAQQQTRRQKETTPWDCADGVRILVNASLETCNNRDNFRALTKSLRHYSLSCVKLGLSHPGSFLSPPFESRRAPMAQGVSSLVSSVLKLGRTQASIHSSAVVYGDISRGSSSTSPKILLERPSFTQDNE
ncbi:hypothetical protein E4U09_008137 [Claviceps aff. purpurea]|uniref:Uncharacterized protein n=1 Tax=Claviceps aff. purpurea TaxID=1967640 RepID=A0A9P7QLC4_9HYPO|nr:hypothetical protein E4U09_008137 [Claviceps aff. purpurea]